MKFHAIALVSFGLLLGFTIGCKTSMSGASLESLAAASKSGGEAQKARFKVYFDALRPAMNGGTDVNMVAPLLEKSGRTPAFFLQALGRLYRDQNPDFNKMREKFKALEDALGEVDKWQGILMYARQNKAPTSSISPLEQRLADSRTALAQFLTAEKWVTAQGSERLAKMERMVNEYPWASYQDDRRFVLSSLNDEIKKTASTNYDMNDLEGGLHELRRQLRWFAITARSLNGLVTFRPDDNDCPVPAYASFVNDPSLAQSPYAALPHAATEVAPCLISKCLYLATNKAIADLGKLKDQVEVTTAGSTNVVPSAIAAQAKVVYDDTLRNRLLPAISEQIASCQR